MVREYKFMFDRRFDDPADDALAEPEDSSQQSEDGVPSISEILDTLDVRMEEAAAALPPEEEEPPPAQDETPPDPVDPFPDPADSIFKGFSQEELDEAVRQAADAAFARGREQGLEEGRAEGRDEGYRQSMDEAMTSVEKRTEELLALIGEELKKLEPVAQKTASDAFDAAVQTALAVCKKALPTLAEKAAVDEIERLLEQNFVFLREEPQLTLRLPPDTVEEVKKKLAALVKKEAYAGKIVVLRDENVPPGDCRVEWKNGGLEKSMQDVLNQTENLLKSYSEGNKANE